MTFPKLEVNIGSIYIDLSIGPKNSVDAKSRLPEFFQNFRHDLTEYKDEREHPSLFRKIFYNSKLTEERLTLCRRILNYLNSSSDWQPIGRSSNSDMQAKGSQYYLKITKKLLKKIEETMEENNHLNRIYKPILNGSLNKCLSEYAQKLALINAQFRAHQNRKAPDARALSDLQELVDDAKVFTERLFRVFE